MKKTNLLPSKPISIYEAISTPREIYETENCFQLIVEDEASLIKKIAEETEKEEGEIVDKLFEKMKDYRLYDTLEKNVDSTQYDVHVKIIDGGGARTANVKISKRSVRKKIREGIRSFLNEHVG